MQVPRYYVTDIISVRHRLQWLMRSWVTASQDLTSDVAAFSLISTRFFYLLPLAIMYAMGSAQYGTG